MTTKLPRPYRRVGCQLCPTPGIPEKPCILEGPDYWGKCHYHQDTFGRYTMPPPAVWSPALGRWESSVR